MDGEEILTVMIALAVVWLLLKMLQGSQGQNAASTGAYLQAAQSAANLSFMDAI